MPILKIFIVLATSTKFRFKIEYKTENICWATVSTIERYLKWYLNVFEVIKYKYVYTYRRVQIPDQALRASCISRSQIDGLPKRWCIPFYFPQDCLEGVRLRTNPRVNKQTIFLRIITCINPGKHDNWLCQTRTQLA